MMPVYRQVEMMKWIFLHAPHEITPPWIPNTVQWQQYRSAGLETFV